MNKKIYFHIGLPKTGTTFLQKNLFSKYDFYIGSYNLKDNGYFQNKLFENIIFNKSFDFKFKKYFLSNETIFFPIDSREFNTYNFNKIISFFKKQNYKIYVILGIRRQDTFAKSIYLESIKKGNVVSIKDYYYKINNPELYLNLHNFPSINSFKYFSVVNFIYNSVDSLKIIVYEDLLNNSNLVLNDLIKYISKNKINYNLNRNNYSYGLFKYYFNRFLNHFFKNTYNNYGFIKGYIPYIKKGSLKFGRFRHILIKFGLKNKWDSFISKFDIPYKDKTGTCKKILDLCKEDNKKLDKKYKLGLKKYGYY